MRSTSDQSQFGTNCSHGMALLLATAMMWPMARITSANDPTTAPRTVDFSTDIQPIFETRCFSCHGATRQRGGLRLDSPAFIQTGGESGPILAAGEASNSLIVQHILGSNGLSRMPPKGDPLTNAEIESIKAWIDGGAGLPAIAANTTAKTESNSRWAFQPITRPSIPIVPDVDHRWIRNPIDAFIVNTLRAKGLSPSPEADRRILARRLSFDLIGLPPTAEETDSFVNDPDENAYEKLVDRLLASPHYGERWARHWLDVAHYADSHGQDQDRFRPNAWPYRDYLIRAFNDDTPYDQFVTEQIAGDIIYSDQPQALAATGFLAAGPWDESGLRDINEDSIDRQIARYLDRDDIVTSTMTTFTGLTVHCARCHDHKFDPITQEDYYAIQAVFAGIDKAERLYDADPEVAKQRTRLVAQLDTVRALEGKLDLALKAPEHVQAVAELERFVSETEAGWVTPDPERWESQNGSSLEVLRDRSILSTGVAPDRDTYTVTLNSAISGLTSLRLEVLCDDTLPHNGPGRCSNGNLHLSEIRVTIQPTGADATPHPVKLVSAIADFDQTGWGIERAIDGDATTAWGIYPEVGKPHQAIFRFEQPVGFESGAAIRVELDQLHGGSHLIGRFRIALTAAAHSSPSLRPLPTAIATTIHTPIEKRTELESAELARWLWEQRLTNEIAGLPPQSRVYCGTNRFTPEGSFKPAATPRVVHVLKRGEISKPGAVAVPGAVVSVKSLPGRFPLKQTEDEGERRVALANWIVSHDNPLTWRVIVNRIWHYHFGRGIVDTPNDFGQMGGTPSHPELLDWLATEFRDRGGSLKTLHKLIVTSSTYRQTAQHNGHAASQDADNRWLWRMNRQRLDAESVRDAVLFASERLNTAMYGEPIKHFISSPGVHVTLVADYDAFDLDTEAARRRSIYRFVFRTVADPMLEALDCPDASQSAPVRSTSLSPVQALVLWNNRFMLRQSEHLAELAESTTKTLDEQISVICSRIYGRLPRKGELADWNTYASRHGLANLCRVFFNSSEFLFID